jgi:5-methylcytosine-specific restriction endonuclease McrA
MYVREKVMERDGYECVKCGSNYEFHVRHTKNEDDHRPNDLTNLITLCPNCHSNYCD